MSSEPPLPQDEAQQRLQQWLREHPEPTPLPAPRENR